MAGDGDARVSTALARALADGPQDVLSILASLRALEPALLRRREGAVHAFLLEQRRAGRVHDAGIGDRGLPLYAQTPPPEPRRADVFAEPVSPAVSRRALRVARGMRDPAARGRATADLLAHIADLRGRGDGAAFGSVKYARTLLRRAESRKSAVHFPSGVDDHLRRFIQNEGLWLLGAVVLFFLVKAYVIEVFVIPSPSMVPTLQLGDRVVVFKPSGRRVPERWSIVTFEFGGQVWVKRLVGLPGERIAVKNGDVYVNGRLLEKPDDVRDVLRFPVAEWDLAAMPEGWTTSSVAAGESWAPGPSMGFWAHLPPGEVSGHPDSTLVRIHDLYLDLDAERGEAGTVALVLARDGALADDPGVEWSLEAGPRGIVVLQSPRPWTDGATTTLAEGPASAPTGRLSLSLSFVDGVLRASAGGWSWSGRPAAPNGPAKFAVVFGGAATKPVHLAMDQDLHYSNDGTIATPKPDGVAAPIDPRLTPEERQRAALRAVHDPDPDSYAFPIDPERVFLMGDNTVDSHDSRYLDVKTIRVEDLVGPAVFRVWPLGRIGRPR